MTFPSQSTTIAREGYVDSPGSCESRGEDGTTPGSANTQTPSSMGWNKAGRKFKAIGYLQRRGLYYRRTKGFWANLTMTQNEH
jgi:hypothetical protein